MGQGGTMGQVGHGRIANRDTLTRFETVTDCNHLHDEKSMLDIDLHRKGEKVKLLKTDTILS